MARPNLFNHLQKDERQHVLDAIRADLQVDSITAEHLRNLWATLAVWAKVRYRKGYMNGVTSSYSRVLARAKKEGGKHAAATKEPVPEGDVDEAAASGRGSSPPAGRAEELGARADAVPQDLREGQA